MRSTMEYFSSSEIHISPASVTLSAVPNGQPMRVTFLQSTPSINFSSAPPSVDQGPSNAHPWGASPAGARSL